MSKSSDVFELPTDLAVGHPVIDDDHGQLVLIINQTAVALENKNFHDSTTLILKFIELMKTHFDREEKILHDAGYPCTERHQQSHRQVLNQLPKLIEECEAVQDGNQAWRKLIDLLIDCLMQDAFEADLHFKEFLAGQASS